jgi:hypothetical protein
MPALNPILLPELRLMLADGDTASIAGWILERARLQLPQLDRVDLFETPGCGAIVSVGDVALTGPL